MFEASSTNFQPVFRERGFFPKKEPSASKFVADVVKIKILR